MRAEDYGIYRAFDWEPPQYAHLPLILNPDGSKLSKRQGDIQVESYRKQGIFPSALLNFITHAGGGFNRSQGAQRCYSYEELIKQVFTFFITDDYSDVSEIEILII